jgi:hypothetical protein
MSFVFFLILLSTAFSQTNVRDKSLSEFFSQKTKITNPLELRDPFKPPKFKGEAKKRDQENKSGIYSNVSEKNYDGILVSDMKVIGVLIGKERRVLIQPSESSKEVITLKEGMKIGPDKSELKAILPGGIILVEKIVNVYGQEEYLETVIPISR